MMAQQQAHEAQLASINQDEHKKKLQITIGVVAFVLVAAVVGGGIAFKKHNDQANAEKAALEARARAAEEEKTRLEGSVKESQEKEAELKSALNNAKDEADRASHPGRAAEGARDHGCGSSGSSNGRQREQRQREQRWRLEAGQGRVQLHPGRPSVLVSLSSSARQRLAFPLDYPTLELARRGAEAVAGRQASSRWASSCSSKKALRRPGSAPSSGATFFSI